MKELTNSEISNIISYAEQDKHIFNDTILNNITLWNSSNYNSLEDVIKFCNLEHLDMSKIVSKDSLSEGEKQKIILARTLLLNKDVLLLDEGTANLDLSNALDLENKLLSLKNKTIIMITHHLNPDLEDRFDQIIRFN